MRTQIRKRRIRRARCISFALMTCRSLIYRENKGRKMGNERKRRVVMPVVYPNPSRTRREEEEEEEEKRKRNTDID